MEQFDDILSRSTAAIGGEYFLRPNLGTDRMHGEIVYRYELYHQLRLHWPAQDFCPYRLNVGNHLADDRLKVMGLSTPDFFVRTPGSSDYYAVLDVHLSRAQTSDVREHLRTLSQFTRLGYQRAIYLVYGADSVMTPMQQLAQGFTAPIEIWFHSHVSTSAA